MAPRKNLRVVPDDAGSEPVELMDAVESGDVLAMLKAQRRLIAKSLEGAAESVRPQLNNELNKLHALIRDEESRQVAAAPPVARKRSGSFDASAI